MCYFLVFPVITIMEGHLMHLYNIMVIDSFKEKFENFLANINIVNSNKVVSILDKKEIVAMPKEEEL